MVGENIILIKKIPTSTNFHQIEIKYYHPNTKYPNVLRTYLDWDTKIGFKCIVHWTYVVLG